MKSAKEKPVTILKNALLKKGIAKETVSILLRGVCACMLLLSSPLSMEAKGADGDKTLLDEYQSYRKRFSEITRQPEIEQAGFGVIEDQIFPIETEGFGQVYLIPALDKAYNRLALFFADEDGNVVYKTDQLEANSRNTGQMKQPIRELKAISFQELNGDDLMDIVLITTCVNDRGSYAGKPYKVGDVLFQDEHSFYRDYRISDKINRFGMNKSVESIVAFVRDGDSAEFLYTAATKKELLDNGFEIAKEQCHYRQFEKFGRLEVVPGTYTMANFATFMIYLVNEQGYIVWSFQPMGDFDNLYALKGIACRDIDGDGMKDIVVFARYSYEGNGNEMLTESDYSIYYQRTGSFYEDTQIKKQYPCGEDDTMSGIVEKARSYWGWNTEE